MTVTVHLARAGAAGFHYNDAGQVANSWERVHEAASATRSSGRADVGIGNEMEGYAKGDNAGHLVPLSIMWPRWSKRMIPIIPPMKVIAEIGGDRVINIHRRVLISMWWNQQLRRHGNHWRRYVQAEEPNPM